jgi:hypothetical protein
MTEKFVHIGSMLEEKGDGNENRGRRIIDVVVA